MDRSAPLPLDSLTGFRNHRAHFGVCSAVRKGHLDSHRNRVLVRRSVQLCGVHTHGQQRHTQPGRRASVAMCVLIHTHARTACGGLDCFWRHCDDLEHLLVVLSVIRLHPFKHTHQPLRVIPFVGLSAGPSPRRGSKDPPLSAIGPRSALTRATAHHTRGQMPTR